MFRILLLLIIIVPAVELAILVYAGYTIGPWITISLIIATGLLGAWLAKREGLQTIKLAQLQMQQGKMPSEVILDGICILVGGAVLLTPGFITDAFGFFLLVPQTRATAKLLLAKVMHSMIKKGNFIIMTRK